MDHTNELSNLLNKNLKNIEGLTNQTAVHRKKFEFALSQVKKFTNKYSKKAKKFKKLTPEKKSAATLIISYLSELQTIMGEYLLETWTNSTIDNPSNTVLNQLKELFTNIKEQAIILSPSCSKYIILDINEWKQYHILDLRAIAASFIQYLNNKNSDTTKPTPESAEIDHKMKQRLISINKETTINNNESNSSTQIKASNSTEFMATRSFSPIPVNYRKWLVNIDDFERQNAIGSGISATVYRGLDKRTGREVAIKEFNYHKLNGNNLQSFQREVAVLATVNHPTLLKLIGATDTPPFCIITEWMPRSSLFKVLHDSTPFDSTLKTIAAFDIARGMQYLHRHHIVHRDLKSLNVLMDEKLRIRICDFAFSRHATDEQTMTSNIGTPHWMAPEILFSHQNYTSKVDVYAYGILLWELVTCQIPYCGIPTKVIMFEVRDRDIRPSLPSSDQVNPKIRDLITQCWDRNPDNRPTFDEIVRRFLDDKIMIDGTNEKVFVDYIKKSSTASEIRNKKVQEVFERAVNKRQISLGAAVRKIKKLGGVPAELVDKLWVPEIVMPNLACEKSQSVMESEESTEKEIENEKSDKETNIKVGNDKKNDSHNSNENNSDINKSESKNSNNSPINNENGNSNNNEKSEIQNSNNPLDRNENVTSNDSNKSESKNSNSSPINSENGNSNGNDNDKIERKNSSSSLINNDKSDICSIGSNSTNISKDASPVNLHNDDGMSDAGDDDDDDENENKKSVSDTFKDTQKIQPSIEVSDEDAANYLLLFKNTSKISEAVRVLRTMKAGSVPHDVMCEFISEVPTGSNDVDADIVAAACRNSCADFASLYASKDSDISLALLVCARNGVDVTLRAAVADLCVMCLATSKDEEEKSEAKSEQTEASNEIAINISSQNNNTESSDCSVSIAANTNASVNSNSNSSSSSISISGAVCGHSGGSVGVSESPLNLSLKSSSGSISTSCNLSSTDSYKTSSLLISSSVMPVRESSFASMKNAAALLCLVGIGKLERISQLVQNSSTNFLLKFLKSKDRSLRNAALVASVSLAKEGRLFLNFGAQKIGVKCDVKINQNLMENQNEVDKIFDYLLDLIEIEPLAASAVVNIVCKQKYYGDKLISKIEKENSIEIHENTLKALMAAAKIDELRGKIKVVLQNSKYKEELGSLVRKFLSLI